jgi:hypothetical protein
MRLLNARRCAPGRGRARCRLLQQSPGRKPGRLGSRGVYPARAFPAAFFIFPAGTASRCWPRKRRQPAVLDSVDVASSAPSRSGASRLSAYWDKTVAARPVPLSGSGPPSTRSQGGPSSRWGRSTARWCWRCWMSRWRRAFAAATSPPRWCWVAGSRRPGCTLGAAGRCSPGRATPRTRR